MQIDTLPDYSKFGNELKKRRSDCWRKIGRIIPLEEVINEHDDDAFTLFARKCFGDGGSFVEGTKSILEQLPDWKNEDLKMEVQSTYYMLCNAIHVQEHLSDAMNRKYPEPQDSEKKALELRHLRKLCQLSIDYINIELLSRLKQKQFSSEQALKVLRRVIVPAIQINKQITAAANIFVEPSFTESALRDNPDGFIREILEHTQLQISGLKDLATEIKASRLNTR